MSSVVSNDLRKSDSVSQSRKISRKSSCKKPSINTHKRPKLNLSFELKHSSATKIRSLHEQKIKIQTNRKS